MGLFEENQEIIEKIQGFIGNICKAEIEEKIPKNEIDAAELDRKIYDGFNQIIRFTRRIYAVNQNIIDSAENLSKEIAQMEKMTIPTGEINFVDKPVNNQNRLVHNFYEKIKSKYGNEYEHHITKNVAENPPKRRLKIDSLDEKEQRQALILDKYLKICWISEQLEQLIDYVKCIQYNYIPQNESGLCDE